MAAENFVFNARTIAVYSSESLHLYPEVPLIMMYDILITPVQHVLGLAVLSILLFKLSSAVPARQKIPGQLQAKVTF